MLPIIGYHVYTEVFKPIMLANTLPAKKLAEVLLYQWVTYWLQWLEVLGFKVRWPVVVMLSVCSCKLQQVVPRVWKYLRTGKTIKALVTVLTVYNKNPARMIKYLTVFRYLAGNGCTRPSDKYSISLILAPHLSFNSVYNGLLFTCTMILLLSSERGLLKLYDTRRVCLRQISVACKWK